MSEIIPDDKNWTFVLDSTCHECHHDVRHVSPRDVIELLPQIVDRFQLVLQRTNARIRSNPARWSDQEYVIHVADMLMVMEHRLELMAANDSPTFPNWDQDQAANNGNYNSVAAQDAKIRLQAAAGKYSRRLASFAPEDLTREGLRSNGSAFTVTTLNQYAWHDVLHHVWDLKA